MTSKNIFGRNRFWPYTRTREGARGVVVRGGLLLAVYERNTVGMQSVAPSAWRLMNAGLVGSQLV